jgi:hypothetical protein
MLYLLPGPGAPAPVPADRCTAPNAAPAAPAAPRPGIMGG